ncbi:MAG: acetylglutamate kinase [Chloroherpetonaceae bacterium]|nr:acetylglutamate kinase [Chthonomonadaceae bacterium]MDW8208961.1 acetylglutamate kinase [Chloroherpetonaceae bacterium]
MTTSGSTQNILPEPTSVDAATRAAVLIEALPYLRRFYGKTVVVKYGGNAMIDETLKSQVMQDVCLLHYVGIQPILVHGGGPEISALMRQMGHEPTFVGGLRVTDATTMEIVEMALAGKVNKGIVSLLNRQGVRAVGLSGKDANLIVASKRESEQGDLGFVGDVAQVNTDILHLLVAQGYIPVVSSVAIGPDGESYNVNADHVAGHIAAALGAAKLIILTDVEGLYADVSDRSTLISEMDTAQAATMIRSGAAARGMIPKLEACITALQAGVERAHLIDGRVPHALLIEIFTDTGIGTMIRPAAEPQDGSGAPNNPAV